MRAGRLRGLSDAPTLANVPAMTSPPPTIADAAELPPARPRKRSAGEVLRALRRPKVAVMLGLGFSSGLPFMLIGNTFNYWLGDAHVDLAVVGFASWVGLSLSLKFIFGAVADNIALPLLGGLGRRRSWMLVAQTMVVCGLAGMALNDPAHRLAACVAFAVLASSGEALQDCAVDAWRIESADDGTELDILTSAYSLGYRVAIILTASVILYMAQTIGWSKSYGVFAALVSVGVVAAVLAREPLRAVVAAAHARRRFDPRRALDAVVQPFVQFFGKLGWAALLVLAVVTTYHLCDYLRGPVINPFYGQVGLQKPLVATVRLAIGIPASMLGIAAGGAVAARFGRFPALLVGGVLQPLAVAAFAVLAATGPDVRVFGVIMAFDDFSMSFAGVVLIAYISTLTSLGYTATQYALLTSALAFTGKILKGFSGTWVKAIAHAGGDLTGAYATYFVYAAAVGAPALLLVLWLSAVDRRARRAKPRTSAAAPASSPA